MADDVKIELLKTYEYKQLDNQEDIDLFVRYLNDFATIEDDNEKIKYGKTFHSLLSAFAKSYVNSKCNYSDLEQLRIYLPFSYYSSFTSLTTIKTEYSKQNFRRKAFSDSADKDLIEKYEDIVKFMEKVNSIPNNKYLEFFKECTFFVVPTNRNMCLQLDNLQNQTGFIYEFIRCVDKNINEFNEFKNNIVDKISEVESLLDRNKTVYSTYIAIFTGFVIAIPSIVNAAL